MEQRRAHTKLLVAACITQGFLFVAMLTTIGSMLARSYPLG
jgi:hypothetical protein